MLPESVDAWASDSVLGAVVVEVNGETEYLEPEQAEYLADQLLDLAGRAEYKSDNFTPPGAVALADGRTPEEAEAVRRAVEEDGFPLEVTLTVNGDGYNRLVTSLEEMADHAEDVGAPEVARDCRAMAEQARQQAMAVVGG